MKERTQSEIIFVFPKQKYKTRIKILAKRADKEIAISS